MTCSLATQLAKDAMPFPPRITPSIGADVFLVVIGMSVRGSTTAGVGLVSSLVSLAVHPVIDDGPDGQVS